MLDKILQMQDGSWDEKYRVISRELWDKRRIHLPSSEALRHIWKRNRDKVEGVANSNIEYTVENGKYILITNNEVYRFTVDEIDEIFFDYSKHGGNMSGQAIISKYRLTPQAWGAIKSKLRLYKDSDVVSPYTLDSSDEKEQERILKEKTGRHINATKAKWIKTHDDMIMKELQGYRKVFGKNQYFLESFQNYLEGYKPNHKQVTTKKKDGSDYLNIVLTDMHIGKLDTDTIIKRLSDVQTKIINHRASKIIITSLGDLGETFAQGGMHPGQIEYGTEQKWGYGFDLLMNITRIFEDFLINIRNSGKSVFVKGIPGNHGRFTSNKQFDIQNTAELCLYELVKRGLSHTDIEVEYFAEKISTFDFDNIHYIIAHGDGNFDKQNPSHIILTHGSMDKYNVILSGDKHHLNMRDISSGKGIWIKSPALAGKGRYDTDMNLHSAPGYLAIQSNSFGSVDIGIIRTYG